jgi:hypothetical protein
MDITGMDWSSTDLYKDIVNSEIFAFELTFGYTFSGAPYSL